MHFVLCEKTTNVNKTHQLIPGIGTDILRVMEPHSEAKLNFIPFGKKPSPVNEIFVNVVPTRSS